MTDMSKKANAKPRYSIPEVKTKSYRTDFIRRKMLQKSFKGNEKGVKTLGKLPDTMHVGIEVLWRQKLMCDVELVTPDRKHFQAHKLVLATCCDYFYDLFAEEADRSNSAIGITEIEVQELNGNILELILEAMYTGKVKIEATSVDDILSAASSLGMFVIMDACEDFLIEHVNKDTCLHVLSTAFKYNLTRLTESSLEIAAKNFQTISKRPMFRALPVEHMVLMLKRNDLEVSSELDAFQKACTWIEEHKPSRLQHAADILATIRLPLLSPSAVVDKVESCGYLMDIPDCQRLVKEALHYHCMPSRQCLLQSPRTVPRQEPEVCLLVVGGAPRLRTDRVSDAILKYSHVTSKWDQVTKMTEPRHHHAAVVFNGFLYVAGGETSNEYCAPLNTACRYDPRNSSWMQIASMEDCRQSFQLGVLNGALYAVGGRVSKEESLSAVEKYDPSLDQWTEVASLCSPRRCVAVGCLGGKLYAVGGSGHKVISSRVERYSPAENKWDLVKAINAPRFFGNLFHVQSYLYLVGGATIDDMGNVACVDTIERYSPLANQWTIVAAMRTPRSESGCAVIKEKIYILGGYNWNASERLADVECFDTETNSWSMLGDMVQPLTGSGAVGLTLFNKKREVKLQI